MEFSKEHFQKVREEIEQSRSDVVKDSTDFMLGIVDVIENKGLQYVIDSWNKADTSYATLNHVDSVLQDFGVTERLTNTNIYQNSEDASLNDFFDSLPESENASFDDRPANGRMISMNNEQYETLKELVVLAEKDVDALNRIISDYRDKDRTFSENQLSDFVQSSIKESQKLTTMILLQVPDAQERLQTSNRPIVIFGLDGNELHLKGTIQSNLEKYSEDINSAKGQLKTYQNLDMDEMNEHYVHLREHIEFRSHEADQLVKMKEIIQSNPTKIHLKGNGNQLDDENANIFEKQIDGSWQNITNHAELSESYKSLDDLLKSGHYYIANESLVLESNNNQSNNKENQHGI